MKHDSKKKGTKPKMTKEERRAKYTQIARDRQSKKWAKTRDATTTCYHCRKTGHAVANCPEIPKASKRICFKCGSTEHGLYQCLKLKSRDDTDLPFASCFVCNQKGHLAKHCSQNTKGMYVNGGCCKNCGSNQHRAVDCPEKSAKKQKKTPDDGPVPEDLLQEVPVSEPIPAAQKKQKRKPVKF